LLPDKLYLISIRNENEREREFWKSVVNCIKVQIAVTR